MPSAQVIDFGEDPYANAVGGFAKSFLGALNEKTAQRRNEQLFEKIKDKYGKDAKGEDILRDVVFAEGFDQSYKQDLIKNLKEYATLANKTDKNLYEQAKLDQRKEELDVRKTTNEIASNRLKNEQAKTANQEDKNLKATAKDINNYSSKFLKDNELSLTPNDKADINLFTEQFMKNKKQGLTEAFNDAYKLITMRREKIDDVKITPFPSYFIGSPNEAEIEPAMQKAYLELKNLYEQDGIDNQSDLRSIAERSG